LQSTAWQCVPANSSRQVVHTHHYAVTKQHNFH